MKKFLYLTFFIYLSCALFSSFGKLCFADEQVTITTYYPAPYGIYRTMIARRMSVGDINGDGALNDNDAPTADDTLLVAGSIGISGVSNLGDAYSALYLNDDNPNINNSWAIAHIKTLGNPTQDDFQIVRWIDPVTSRIDIAVDSVTGDVGIGTVDPQSPAPNAADGNLDVNDVWIRSGNGGAGSWVSQGLLQYTTEYTAGGGGLNPVQMIPSSQGVCFLTHCYDGAGSSGCTVYINNTNGYWYVSSGWPSYAVKARCIKGVSPP